MSRCGAPGWVAQSTTARNSTSAAEAGDAASKSPATIHARIADTPDYRPSLSPRLAPVIAPSKALQIPDLANNGRGLFRLLPHMQRDLGGRRCRHALPRPGIDRRQLGEEPLQFLMVILLLWTHGASSLDG